MGACKQCVEKVSRRRAVMGFGGIGLGLMPDLVLGQTDPASVPPQEGDVLVGLSDAEHKPLRPDDIVAGALPTLVWPMIPASNMVRSQNRLNQLLLIRLDSSTMNVETRSMSADGVLAFSALCTHAGCTITDWIPERRVLFCQCHESEFDPREAGKVVDGPAARPLPPLPLKLVSGLLTVAKPFAMPIRTDE